MHENIEKINFIKIVFVLIFIKLIFFPMFSCILRFVDKLMMLSTYLLRFGTQMPVDPLDYSVVPSLYISSLF